MATSPMMMPQGGPAMAQPGEQAPGATKTICIEQDAQGALSVGIKAAGGEMGGMEGMPEGAPGEMAQDKSYMQPAKDIEDALNQARQLLQGGEESGMSVEQAFQGGFSGAPQDGAP